MFSQYTDNAHEIIPGLWLGNFAASSDKKFLEQNNIQIVVNCTKNLPFANNAPVKIRVPLDDVDEPEEVNNLTLWAPEVVYKILQYHYTGHNILVHCQAGVSRSCSVMTMILIADKQIHTDQAVEYVKKKRPIAFIGGMNFRKAIDAFDDYFHKQIAPQLVEYKLKDD